jgi:ABC-type lipoprotein release transport system permease subunit
MVEWFLARRYLFSSRNRLLHLVSLAAAFGVAIGVATLLVVISVNNGFLAVFRARILDVYPHLVVMKRFEPFTDYREVAARLAATPGIAGVSHATYDEMMLSSGGRNRGVLVKGVDPQAPMVRQVTGAFLKGGSLDALVEQATAKRDGARVVLSGLVQGGVYRLLVGDAGQGLHLLAAEGTAPGPSSCRVRALVLPTGDGAATDPDQPIVATRADGRQVPIPRDAGVDLDLGPYTAVGAYTRGGFECRYNERVLLLVRPSADIVPLVEPRWDRALHEAQVLVDNLTPEPIEVVVERPPDDTRGGSDEPVTVGADSRGVLVRTPGAAPAMFLGVALAETLDVKAGDQVTLLTPLRGLENRGLAPFGMAPTAQHFRVAGTLQTDFNDFDQRLVVTSYTWMTRFSNQGDEPRWVEVRLSDPERLDDGERLVRGVLDPYDLVDWLQGVLGFVDRTRDIVSVSGAPGLDATLGATLASATAALHLAKYEDLSFGFSERFKVVDWEDMNRNLFSSLTLQKVVLALFFLIIVVIASFSIVSTQLLLLSSKLPDIAILRSMGARRVSIARVFTLHGLLLAVAGVLGGLLLGGGALWLLTEVRFRLDPAVYLVSYLPVEVRPLEIGLVAGLALLSALVTVRAGAAWAASRRPIEALRLKK